MESEKMKYVLIIGDTEDTHLNSVIDKLKKLNAHVIILFPDKSQCYVSIQITQDISDAIITNGELSITSKQVQSVFYRHTGRSGKEFKTLEEKLQFDYTANEWHHTLTSLVLFIPKEKWINPPTCEQLRKPEQLLTAKTLGFKIPNTVVSNSVVDIGKQFKALDKFIFKAVDRCDGLFTTEITNDSIKDEGPSLQLSPLIYQNRCNKDFDLRITVIGDEIFGVKIHSQKTEETSLDWRINQSDKSMFAIYELDPLFKTKLLELHKKFNLVAGAYDFVGEEGKEPVFLEVNPHNFAWVYYENCTGLPISEAIAKKLLSI
jgi:hypothetical protein